MTSPPHSSNKKDDGLKRERECQELNDSDEDDDEEEGDLLEEEEVRPLSCRSPFHKTNLKILD